MTGYLGLWFWNGIGKGKAVLSAFSSPYWHCFPTFSSLFWKRVCVPLGYFMKNENHKHRAHL